MHFVHPTIPHDERFRPDGTPYRNSEPWRPALALRRAARVEFKRLFVAAMGTAGEAPGWRFPVRFEEVCGVQAERVDGGMKVTVQTDVRGHWQVVAETDRGWSAVSTQPAMRRLPDAVRWCVGERWWSDRHLSAFEAGLAGDGSERT